jgi:diguanylate cyclase
MPQTVLLIEDNAPSAALVKQAIVGSGEGRFAVEWVRKCSEAQERLCMHRNSAIAAVVTNLFLPDSQGLQTIDRILEVSPHVAILVLTTADNEPVAKQAMRHGAKHYVLQHRLDSYSLPKILQNILHEGVSTEVLFANNRRTRAVFDSIGDTLHDHLTHLPNALLLNDRLSQAIACARRHQQSFAVLCVDIDRFEHVNYALGREIADHLLRSIAQRLIDNVSATDTVSRQQADQFMVLLSELAHTEDAALSAERILASLSMPHRVENHDLQITATIGIGVYPHDGTDAETLVRNASTAMLNAKEQGHNTYAFFKPHMNEQTIERRFLECGLRHALERQEFVLHYAAQIDLQTQTIVGAEALVRWRRPQQGMALPAEFMAVAEQSGYIIKIGLWALREACRQARSWRDANLAPISLAVKISALELRSKSFVEKVRAILLETGMEAQCLALEITEFALLNNWRTIAPVLNALRNLGVQLALDHFGTGSSSLTHLKRLPLDALKIDESLVRGLRTGDNEAMVNAVIGTAKSFHLRVIAQGIETREQFLVLRRLQCLEGQGPYFHEPAAATEFAMLLKAGCTTIAT